jgi:hypothetical protein
MRLAVGTVKGRWANLHLLVSPEDPHHLEELWRFLSRLSFPAYDDRFNCTASDLIKLGKKADPSLTGEAALEKGATQFKVSFSELVALYSGSAWAKENIIVAVAGSEDDGTSGIRDAADATLRQEIEKFAHIIFASSTSQRDFWLGRKSASVETLRTRYGGLKPCLHGSDGHDHDSAATPTGDRYSWIKGAVAFDSLRQAIIDPAGRAYVGPNPPFRATPSQVISSVNVKGAAWLQTPSLELNAGLIAIIGARGSGKTALADAIAAGCNATSGRLGLKLSTADHDRDSRALQKAVLSWTAKNYAWLHAYNPRVAEACLVDGLTYDAEHLRLVKTYAAEGLRREPHYVHLQIDPAPRTPERTEE